MLNLILHLFASVFSANPVKQAMILNTVVSNLVFDGAAITPTYRKPFDVLAERPSTENWLPGLVSESAILWDVGAPSKSLE